RPGALYLVRAGAPGASRHAARAYWRERPTECPRASRLAAWPGPASKRPRAGTGMGRGDIRPRPTCGVGDEGAAIGPTATGCEHGAGPHTTAGASHIDALPRGSGARQAPLRKLRSPLGGQDRAPSLLLPGVPVAGVA